MEKKIYKSKCRYCGGDLEMYTHEDRNIIGDKGFTTVLCCKGCAGHLFEFSFNEEDIPNAEKILLKRYGIKSGGLKFTSVSGKLTLDEAAVFGSTGVIRIIYLIDLCQLYHGYDQTDQLKNNACFIGLKHIIRGVLKCQKDCQK